MRLRLALVGVGLAVLTASVLAQAPLDRFTFDAASVKRSDSGLAPGGVGLRPGGYAASNTFLRTIILHAYRLKSVQLVGGPDWIDAERFDIQARAPRAASDDELFEMVRALLADRFKLAVHWETRELPVYDLVQGRNDGRLGAAISPSGAECSADANPCGMYTTSRAPNGGSITTKGRTLDDFASALGGMLDRTVVNRTTLSGRYAIDLTWGPDAGSQATDDAPMVFTAIQEQLGLRLEPSKGQVDVLVIDRIEWPTEN